MESLINEISEQWDLWIGPYRAFFPDNGEDIQVCLRILSESESADPDELQESRPLNLYQDSSFRIAACQDTRTGEIIASLRLTDAVRMCRDLQKRAAFPFDIFDEERLASLAVFTHLGVTAEQDTASPAMVLMSHCFIEVLKAGGQAVLASCAPEQFSMFRRLGMRPIGAPGKTSGGAYRIPMICLADEDYLSIIHSPVLPLLRGVDFNDYRPLCQWYYQLVRENSELQTGSALFPEDEEDFKGHHTITDGLSEGGRQHFFKNAMVMHCREDEVLITENDGGKAFGYVRKGMVKVVIGGKTVVLLGEGDVFGEIAFILQTTRTAQVVAVGEDTEVVLFSESAINNLDDDADRVVIWRNLARMLAQRVVLTNKLLD